MANSWLRLWHDMPNDPKWRTIARVSKQSISLVKAVYLHLLVDASQNKDRGLFSISAEDLSSALDVEDADIRAILESMQGRVLDGQRLSGWQERQPSLETGGDGNNSRGYGSNYVYYVVCRSTSLVKIGVSRNPWSRLKDLQTAAGSKYEMLASIKTDMRSEVEVHKLFAASRVRGEWFKYTEALSRVVEALKSKEIEDYAAMLALIAELPGAMFTATVVATVETPQTTVATKDTDTDTDTDKKKEDKSSLRAKRLPTDFMPDLEFAKSEGVDGEREFEKFRDYWSAQGAKGAKTDWPATWRNWCRNAKKPPGVTPMSKSNTRPKWVLDAGFTNIHEANNEGCFERNAHEFQSGKRSEVAA